jgi:redox-sensing transcriptional repressor
MVVKESARGAGPVNVPEVVVQRLPLYIRMLRRLLEEGVEVVSSQQLGSRLQVTPAQIRKDLSYFGHFGKQGRGYSVRHLLNELKKTLGLDRQWKVVLVGVGRLGRAIIGYPGFAPEGFKVVAAFDTDPQVVGETIGDLTVQPVEDLEEVVRSLGIKIAIVAVPADQAQEVIDHLVSCGVRAILNYAPLAARLPSGVRVRSIDPVLALQSMTFYLKG